MVRIVFSSCHAHDFSNPPTLYHLSADHCFVACTERRKKEAVASVSTATDAAMDAINSGTTTIWHNQQQLEAEARLLDQQTERLAKQSAQWVSSYQGFHQALKALGDVENWAKTIEADMAFIHSSLETMQQQQQQQQQ